MTGLISPLASLGIAADQELTKVLDIAAHVGDTSGDEVNVSYTSLWGSKDVTRFSFRSGSW